MSGALEFEPEIDVGLAVTDACARVDEMYSSELDRLRPRVAELLQAIDRRRALNPTAAPLADGWRSALPTPTPPPSADRSILPFKRPPRGAA